ncbi:macrophage mannose receptor 1-like [Aphelenchoides avenae]|nr:macrophage mannose receptor 1-like [Aphelenchus avenae]
MMDMHDGTWYSRSCETTNPYICKVPPTGSAPAKSCPPAWTYVADAGKCLRVVGTDTWANLEAQCKGLGGNLVSVHSKSANCAIVDFAFTATGMEDSNWAWFAIGLHKPSSTFTYQWTDGSVVDYTNWDVDFPSSRRVTVTYIGVIGKSNLNYGSLNGRWEDCTTGVNCNSDKTKGICQLVQ